jgi:phytoene/squalene synthetase
VSVRRGWRTPKVPARLVAGLVTDRARPELVALSRESDPEKFLWGILPHAARSFAASIVVLPEGQARAAAIAYLYCRMLDTYEDLAPTPGEAEESLGRFARRFEGDLPAATPTLDPGSAVAAGERAYLLLLAKIGLIDRLYLDLDRTTRDQVAGLVASMADGMIWSTAVFDRQGGVLVDRNQLSIYCRNVIGNPILFMLEQVGSRGLDASQREDALRASEMIQLANITRDIEKDLARGISYHPDLKPYLGRAGGDPDVAPVVRRVRQEYLGMALKQAPAYRRMFEGLRLDGSPRVRMAAVLMLLFTDLHYRGCALRTGNLPWAGPRGATQVIARAVPSLVSRSAATRTIRRVERDFLSALDRLGVSPA